MRVIATITIDAKKETRIEGDSRLFDPVSFSGDKLEQENIGFWLNDWRYSETFARPHKKSRVFVPWTSCLYVETKD